MSSHRALWRRISRLLVAAMILAQAFVPLAARAAPPGAGAKISADAAARSTPTPTPKSTKPRLPTARTPFHLEPAKEKLRIATSSALPNGTVLASFTAPAPNNDRYGRAMASDGTYLYITYSVIHNSSTGGDSADPYVYQLLTNGHLHKTFNVGVTLGAMAWDPTRNLFWATDYHGSLGTIYTFDPSTGTMTTKFTYIVPGGNCTHQSPGQYDGLGYDPSTDTLWLSDDTGNMVFHLTTAGTLKSSFPFDQTGYTCQTGIAVQTFSSGSPILWLVDIFNNAIVPTDLNGNLLQGAFFASSASYVESILYDASSFRGKCAVWENNANQTPTIMAYQVSCARPSSVTVAPIAEQSPSGTDQNAPSLFSPPITPGRTRTTTRIAC